MPVSSIVNALTIDVEDYFQVSAFAPHIARSEWNTRTCHIERNVDRILEMLANRNIKATFFTLGWIAERYPQVVQNIVEEGHELASHGYGHERVNDQTAEAFFADIQLAKILLEDLAGCEIYGYRAPSFSIGEGNLWAFECLSRAGYRYSSSIYPIRHDHYGMPNAARFAHEVRPGLMEIPMTTFRILNCNIPSSGGGYFRLLPYAASRWMLNQVNSNEGESGVFYFHPWEIDVEQPRIEGISRKTRFRHYQNIDRMEGRLNQLLHDFKWGRMDAIFLSKLTEHASVD